MDPHPYERLTPDLILDAVEAQGFGVDGHLHPLNSYENRVYQIGLDEGGFLIAKFYRPERWSDAAILEEHAFSHDLEEAEIPLVAPLANPGGETLLSHGGFRFALYPRVGGRWPELEDMDVLYRLGRLVGRIHAVGAARPFRHRPRLDPASFGAASRDFLLEQGFLPPEHRQQYADLSGEALELIRDTFDSLGELQAIRLHGDFHPGNILWGEQGGYLVDLDDCRSGLVVQDLWMLLSGERAEMARQLAELLEGYGEFFDFDHRQLRLIEPLRELRQLHYSAWLARRWGDPAFPAAFPWFNTTAYWEEQILTLREQITRLRQPPLSTQGG